MRSWCKAPDWAMSPLNLISATHIRNAAAPPCGLDWGEGAPLGWVRSLVTSFPAKW